MLKKLPAAVLALIMILASVMLPSLAAAEEAPVQAAQSALRMPEEGAQGVQAAEETSAAGAALYEDGEAAKRLLNELPCVITPA